MCRHLVSEASRHLHGCFEHAVPEVVAVQPVHAARRQLLRPHDPDRLEASQRSADRLVRADPRHAMHVTDGEHADAFEPVPVQRPQRHRFEAPEQPGRRIAQVHAVEATPTRVEATLVTGYVLARSTEKPVRPGHVPAGQGEVLPETQRESW